MKSRLRYQRLECKQLLAGITLDPTTGIVEVIGTSESDQVLIDNPTPNRIQIDLVGIDTKTFDAADVMLVEFAGFQGDDFFENDALVESLVYAGEGNDVLSGGFLTDTFYGGSGNDELNGNGGNDLLVGREGRDTILEVMAMTICAAIVRKT